MMGSFSKISPHVWPQRLKTLINMLEAGCFRFIPTITYIICISNGRIPKETKTVSVLELTLINIMWEEIGTHSEHMHEQISENLGY